MFQLSPPLVVSPQAQVFYYKDWTLGDELCKLHAFMRYWMVGTVMMLLSVIALYRYVHVVRPQQTNRFSQNPTFSSAVAFCWMFSLIFTFPPAIDLWGKFSFQRKILQCTFDVSETSLSVMSNKITIIILGYIVPYIFLCVCYARIGCVVCSSRKRTTRGGSVNRKQRAKRDSMRLTVMMVLIFVGFLLGTTPYFLINTLDSKLEHALPHIFAPMLTWVMYGLNPVIYTVMDVQFQQAYKRLLLCVFHRAEAKVEVTSPGNLERNNSLLPTRDHVRVNNSP